MHTGPTNARALARKREEFAWDLSLKGANQDTIIAEMEKAGLGRPSQQAISAMLLRVEKRFLEDQSFRIGGEKQRQTDLLMEIYDQAMEAWEHSKQPKKSTSRTMSGDSDDSAKPGKVSVNVRDSDGDPRFLEQAMRALADIRKIWGMDAPTKIAPTTPDGENEYQGAAAQMTEEQLRAIASMRRLVSGNLSAASEN